MTKMPNPVLEYAPAQSNTWRRPVGGIVATLILILIGLAFTNWLTTEVRLRQEAARRLAANRPQTMWPATRITFTPSGQIFLPDGRLGQLAEMKKLTAAEAASLDPTKLVDETVQEFRAEQA